MRETKISVEGSAVVAADELSRRSSNGATEENF